MSAAAKSYPVEALNFTQEIRLQSLISKWKAREPGLSYEMSSEYNLVFPLGKDAYAYVYFFGAVVLFNVSDAAARKTFVSTVSKLTGAGTPTGSEDYTIEVDPAAAADVVDFSKAVLKRLDRDAIDIVCLVLAQSTALDAHEQSTERVLEDTAALTESMQKTGKLPYGRRDLTKMIGFSMAKRNAILASFYVLEESPESVWENARLEKLFQAMTRMFDIDARYKSLDRKLTSIQDSLSLIVDLFYARRTMILEFWIVALIVFEIGLMMLEFRH